jgi:hypothetical protein
VPGTTASKVRVTANARTVSFDRIGVLDLQLLGEIAFE